MKNLTGFGLTGYMAIDNPAGCEYFVNFL